MSLSRRALSMARRDGGRHTIPTEPEPATRTRRDADLSARPAQAKDTRRRTRLVLLVLRRRRRDEFRQVRAKTHPRARADDDVSVSVSVSVARPGPSHQAAARGSPSVPSAFFGPQSDTRLYWSAGGRSLTTCAPMRLGLETAWKDHDRRVGSLGSFASFLVSFFSPAGLERTLGPDADRRPRRSPVSRRSRALIALR